MTAETMAHDETDATDTSEPPEAPGLPEDPVPTSHAGLLPRLTQAL